LGVKPYPKYLDWLRYACAWFLYFYGISKLTGHQLVVPAWVAQKPIGSLDGFTLTWYYFGYSHAYKCILGLLQVFSASLLLFRKTALLAAVMIVPMMANIVLINIFYRIVAGAEFLAFFILGSMLLLVWHQREAFQEILWTSQLSESKSTLKLHWLVRSIILLYALGVLAVGTVGFNFFQHMADSAQRHHDAAK
jgi:hypothetical protein